MINQSIIPHRGDKVGLTSLAIGCCAGSLMWSVGYQVHIVLLIGLTGVVAIAWIHYLSTTRWRARYVSFVFYMFGCAWSALMLAASDGALLAQAPAWLLVVAIIPLVIAASVAALALTLVVRLLMAALPDRAHSYVNIARCAHCGYDMRLLSGERCPECGHSSDGPRYSLARKCVGMALPYTKVLALVVLLCLVLGVICTWHRQHRQLLQFRDTFRAPSASATAASFVDARGDGVCLGEAATLPIDTVKGTGIMVVVLPTSWRRPLLLQVRLVWLVPLAGSSDVVSLDGYPPVLCNFVGEEAETLITNGLPASLIAELHAAARAGGWPETRPIDVITPGRKYTSGGASPKDPIEIEHDK